MRGFGLVFAGGGGKGAYQIGVWKYLHEYSIDQYVTGVSGTSVGALNAALFASGDFQQAEMLWKNIQPDQILKPKIFTAELFQRPILSAGFLVPLCATLAKSLLLTPAMLSVSMLNMYRHSFSFSRKGLQTLMDSGIDFDRVQSNLSPCFATCLSFPDCNVHRFDLRSYSSEDIKTILLASSAIPLIFDSVSFEGTTYYDGGLPYVGDNIPIAPLYEQGITTIVVVHLSQTALIDRTQYPGANIFEIVPQSDLGDMLSGTLDFTAHGASLRMEQGYRDAQRIFQPLIEQLILTYKNNTMLQRAQQQHEMFAQQHSQNKKILKTHKEMMSTDGIAEFCAKGK